jgi:hypothetical protein
VIGFGLAHLGTTWHNMAARKLSTYRHPTDIPDGSSAIGPALAAVLATVAGAG